MSESIDTDIDTDADADADTNTETGTDTNATDATLSTVTPECTLSDINGLSGPRSRIRQTLIQSATSDIPPEMRTLSVCLHGPVGAGKRRLAQAIAGTLAEADADADAGYDCSYFYSLEESGHYPAEALEQILEQSRQAQPHVVILDCFDEAHFSEAVIRSFVRHIDRLRSHGHDVCLVAIIDTHLLFGGAIKRFVQNAGITVKLDRPNLERRRLILQEAFATAADASDAIAPQDYDLDRIARETDRFGVDDLYNLTRRAVSTAETNRGPTPPLTTEDFSTLISQVSDETLQQTADEYVLADVDVPQLTFDDIGGLHNPKQKLREQIQQTLTDTGPGAHHDSGTSGILLHGPPGTGKTMLVQALANELDYTLIPVNGPEMKSAHGGGPGHKLPELFDRAERNSPAILFFDEFDTLGGDRTIESGDNSAVNTLLTELDGLDPRSEIVIIGATNLPETLDSALLRPGRFDYHVKVPVPQTDAQAEIFDIHTENLPLADDVTGEWFANITGEVTGADIATICDRAMAVAHRSTDDTPELVTRADFDTGYDEFTTSRIDRSSLADQPPRAFK